MGGRDVTTLDAEKQMVSDLWLDQSDAHERIDGRLQAGTISSDEAASLRHFTDHGYATLSLDLDDEFFGAFDADIDRLWDERPFDLAVGSAGMRVSFRDYEDDRALGHRLPDIHSHSPTARSLYLNSKIFRMVELIFGQRSIAFQSLYFQFGSQQDLHRDPMFVTTRPPPNLLASWTALEDITLERGPLMYARGSHRMPWFEFSDDSVSLTPAVSEERRQAWRSYRDDMIETMNCAVETFTCKRGDVFLWHAGLLHGGQRVADEKLTRKSFVVHYSTEAHYRDRTASMHVKSRENGEEVWRLVKGTTDHRLHADGFLGLDNPLRYIPSTEAARITA